MRSLYGKFLLITLGIMVLSTLLSFLAVNTYYHQQLKAQNDEKNMMILKDIVHLIESDKTLYLDDYLKTQANVGYKLILQNEKGESSFYGADFRLNNLSENTIEKVLDGEDYHGMRDLPKETFVTGFFSDESANTVGTSFQHNGERYALFLRPNIKMLFTEVHYLLGGMFLFMALISLISMLYVARKLVQPITELTEATKKVGAEQFTVSLPTKRGDEIGKLANSFQNMAEQLQKSDQMRKQFINDVSHDFQSPLQNIKGYANLLNECDIDEKERLNYTEIIQSETERLSKLTKQLLLLTSLDSLPEQVELQDFDVGEQLKDVLKRYRWLLEESNISLRAEINDITVRGNKAYIEKVWENLLSNAIKYTPPNGAIDITLRKVNNNLFVIFSDNGIGISTSNLPYVFDRFYRVDDARQTNIEGTGLGLAIVQQIVDLHDGSIEIESKVGEGTTFTVSLPNVTS